jgi:hypothetical protein
MDTHRRPFNQIMDSKSGWGREYQHNKMGVWQSPRKDAASRGYLDDSELEDGEWPSQGRGTFNRIISSRKEPSHHQPSAKKTRSRGKKKAMTDMGFGTSVNPNFVPVAPRASGGYGNKSPKLTHSPPLPNAPPPPLPPFPNLPSSASPPLPNETELSSPIADISTFKSQLDSLKQKLQHHQDARKEWDEKQRALTEEIAVLEKTVHDYRTLYYKADEFGKRTFAELLHYKAWSKERGLEVPAFEPSIENVNAYIISERDKVDFKTALHIFRAESTPREN